LIVRLCPQAHEAAIGVTAAKGRFVRDLPIVAPCSERHICIDQPFEKCAAKQPEEPKVGESAARTNVGFSTWQINFPNA
ncbi:hypothetical protein, partial [uncultured Ruegeria sp.]|uniref:hypothetical protein n=1 Tax=uncultured Ruegeria sp. TaxID=259304 RepID=UPI002627C1A2